MRKTSIDMEILLNRNENIKNKDCEYEDKIEPGI